MKKRRNSIEYCDGLLSWEAEFPNRAVSEYWHSPINIGFLEWILISVLAPLYSRTVPVLWGGMNH